MSIIVNGDSDTTYDFESIPRLLNPVREGEANIILENRLVGDIEEGVNLALDRYVGNPLQTKFLN